MKRVSRWLAASTASAVIATLGLFAASAPAGASGTRVVRPGQSIQAAIDAAAPGDTIVVQRGTYAENLDIGKDGIRLIGAGATLTPPAAPTPTACSDADHPDAVNGICIHGDPATNAPVQGVSVIGFTVRDFHGIGIFTIGAQDTRIVANRTLDDGAYGIFDNSSSGTKIIGNVATNGQEAGIYVGDSPEANATVVGNDSSGSGWGVFVRNAEHATIIGNRLHDNCVGILFLADAPGPTGASAVTGNLITHNTKACPAGGDGTPAISGIGIAISGAHNVSARGNIITGNVSGGETAFSGGVVVVQGGPAGTAPANNTVRGNIILRNDPDLFWDGSGTGNIFAHNLCRTSVPGGLC